MPASAASAQSAGPEFTIHDVSSDLEISSLEYNSSSQYGGAAFEIKVDGPPQYCPERRVPSSCHESLIIKAQTVTSRTWRNVHGINQNLTFDLCPSGFQVRHIGGGRSCPGGFVATTRPTCDWYVIKRESERSRILRNDPNADVRAFDCESVVTVRQAPFRLQVDGQRGWWFVKKITPDNWDDPIRVDVSMVDGVGLSGSYDVELSISQFHDGWFKRTLPISYSPTSTNQLPRAFSVVGPDDQGPEDDAIVIGKGIPGVEELTQDSQQAPDYTDYQTVVDYLVQVRDNPANSAVRGNPFHIRKWNRVLAAVGHPSSEAPMEVSDIHANAAKWPDSPWAAPSLYLKSQAQTPPPPPPLTPTPEVTITAAAGGTEGQPVSFTVTASPAPAADLPVSITVATSGDFGFGTAPTSVTIPASGTAAVTISTTDDSADEPDGSVTLTLVAGSGYTVGTPSAQTATVADDDPPPSPTPVVTVTGGSGVTEGGSAEFTVSASPAPAAGLDVIVTIAAAGDFGITAGTRTVTISASGTATLSVATTDDSADEADGSVTATVVDGAGYDLGTSKTATVTVSDDDPTPPPVQDQPDDPDDVVLAGCGDSEPTLSISSPAASRSDATVEFEVALSCVPAGSPMVLVTPVRDGDIGENLFVSFSAGQTTATVTVDIGAEHRLGLALVWSSGLANRAAQGNVAFTD